VIHSAENCCGAEEVRPAHAATPASTSAWVSFHIACTAAYPCYMGALMRGV